MRRFLQLAIVFGLTATLAAHDLMAASPRQKTGGKGARTQSRQGGSITGRVVGEGGQPIPEASVSAMPVGRRNGPNESDLFKLRSELTDDQGRFSHDDLAPGVYLLMVFVPGFVATPDPVDAGKRKYYRPGDAVTLRMRKGGVITGRVTTATGEPIVGVRVRPMFLRDGEGRVARPGSSNPLQDFQEWKTDDRGVYRAFGLEPGVYVVSASGSGIMPFSMEAYDNDAPTYYPSSTRDTAGEVKVNSGDEAAGIDIRYRDGKGHSVSGSITGAQDGRPESDAIVVTLSRATNELPEAITFSFPFMANRTYAFTGVSDGEYYVNAIRGGEEGELMASPRKRVVVQGTDVTGVELVLAPLGSLAGRIALEKAVQTDPAAACREKRANTIQEIVLSTRSDQKGAPAEQSFPIIPFALLPIQKDTAPDVKGDFVIRPLQAGRYRLETQLPNENWFVRSITVPAAAASGPPQDAARNGVPLKAGERLKGLAITIAEGAAGMSGKVVSAVEGSTLPTNLYVHAVPAEPDQANYVLRYYETAVAADGSFALRNLAPGRYFLVALQAPESQPGEETKRPASWETKSRAELRSAAEAAAASIELKPCQRATNHLLRLVRQDGKPAVKKAGG